MRQDTTTMTREELEAEIEFLQEHFEECARIGQGISTKEGARMRRLLAEMETRSLQIAA